MSAAAGLELTGQFVDTLNPNKKYAAYIEGIYGLAMEARRPVYSESLAMAARASATRTTRRLTCPLASDGRTIDMFFSAQTFEETGGSAAPSLTYADSFRAADHRGAGGLTRYGPVIAARRRARLSVISRCRM